MIHRNGVAESWEDRRALADRSRECCGRAGPGQHPCPHSSALAQACSALLGGKEPMAAGGQCYHRASAQGEQCPSCPGELGCGSPSCGTQFQQQLHPHGADTEAALPSDLQNITLAFSKEQPVPGRREREIPWLTLLRGEQQVFCVVELVKEFLVSLASRHIMC